jgi:hypothetical protein
MYGTFIIDPKQGRPPADEMIMVMHGYNTTLDYRHTHRRVGVGRN